MTKERQDVAILAAADALLAICAVQTGSDPMRAISRALAAIATIDARAQAEQERTR